MFSHVFLSRKMQAVYCVLICMVIVVISSSARPQPSDFIVFLDSNSSISEKYSPVRSYYLPSQRKPNFKEAADDQIIFPDDDEEDYEDDPTEKIPTIAVSMQYIPNPQNCAAGTTFCENVENYPSAKIKNLIHQTKDIKRLSVDESEDDMAIRNSNSPEDVFLCPSTQKIIFPKTAKSKNNEWKYILNEENSIDFKQGIMVEICRRLHGPCEIITELPSGITAKCKQKFVYKRLWSLSSKGKAAVDTFLMPSACCCAYSKDIRFFFRNGGNVSPIK